MEGEKDKKTDKKRGEERKKETGRNGKNDRGGQR